MNTVREPAKSDDSQNSSARATGSALADTYKALRTIGFYPNGHPLRTESLRVAHKALSAILVGGELNLVVTRAGFSAIEGGAIVDNNPMAQSFARELFLRRTQRLTILTDLSHEDLSIFLSLMTVEPQKFATTGSFKAELGKRKIKTIWANEIDLSQIWAKRQAMEAVEAPPLPGGEEGFLSPEASPEIPPPELSIEELISLMAEEPDESRYLQLARQAAAKGECLKGSGEFSSLLPPMEALVQQCGAAAPSATHREYALYTLEQMAGGAMTDFLLRQVERAGREEPERIYLIVQRLGEKMVYPLLHRLCIAEGLLARKALAAALVQIGPAALAPLVNMLHDERWYVVRNMVSIIGEIGSRDSVAAMKIPLEHPDERVRKEAMRTLVKIGGEEAEQVVIAVLDDKGASIVRQAILSLGIMKSQAAVQPLIDIVLARDIFLASLPHKKDAVQALGRIGDKRVTPFLLDMLESRRLLSWNKWEELKLAAAAALGQLGDEAALPALKDRAKQQNLLGKACGDAIDAIERLAGGDL